MLRYLLIYLATISLIAVALTAHDKKAARLAERRISERTLINVALLGGAAAMLVTMRSVRHKTKHLKFIVGLPVIIALHLAIAVGAVLWHLWRG